MAFRRKFEIVTVALLIPLVSTGCEKGGEPAESARNAPASEPASQPAPAAVPAPTPSESRSALPSGHPPMATATPEIGEDGLLKLTGLTMKVPETWEVEPIAPGPFAAKAAFRIPAGENGETCSVRVTHYPNMKGKNDMNIERWASQIIKPDGTPATKDSAMITISSNAEGTIELTMVEIEGSLRSGMQASGPVVPNQRLMAGILDHDQGPHFVKITGSIEAMTKVDESIGAFILSAKTD